MSTYSNNCVGCGCGPSIPEPCVTPPPICPTPEPCTEILDSQCVKYTGPAITCNDIVIIETNVSVAEALTALAELTCTDACCTVPVVDIITDPDFIMLCTNTYDKCSYIGLLYNWLAINDSVQGDGRVIKGIVNTNTIDNPINTWRVPNISDWNALIFQLDPAATFAPLPQSNVAGGKMKTVNCWSIPNSAATNSSLFASQSSVFRETTGIFSVNDGKSSIYWAADEDTSPVTGTAPAYILGFDSADILQNSFQKQAGFKLRVARPIDCAETEGMLIPNAYKDNSGNLYNGIVIGGLVWTVTDLYDQKLNDGTSIPNLSLAGDWSTATTPAFVYPENDIAYESYFITGCQESKINFTTFLQYVNVGKVVLQAGPGITIQGNVKGEVTYYNISATGATPKYKIYSALISQSGTLAPTVTILENTIGNIFWKYNNVGSYIGELIGAFTQDKTMVFISRQAGGPSAAYVFASRTSVDQVMVTTGLVTGGPNDGYIDGASIEIRVYY